MNTNKVSFNPVQGLEDIIKNQALSPGYLYFATDSGRMFLDTEEKRLLVGGNGVSVHYASAVNVQERPDGYYWLDKQDLNKEEEIKPDDLIINSDGRFFRVFSLSVDNHIIICSLLAVSGTGSGGGPGGDGPATNEKDIDVIWHNLKYSFVAGTPYYITFTANSKMDQYLNVEYKVQTETAIVETKTLQVRSGEKKSVEVGSKMAITGSNAVYFTITGANSNPYTKNFKGIKAVDFRIEQDNNNFTNYKIYKEAVNYYVNIYGEIAKTLYIEIDGDKNIIPPRYLEARDYIALPIDIQCSTLGLLPGAHTITAYLEAEGIYSDKIVTDFIYHPDDADDATYVLVTEYPQKIYSYENPIIKYWVWDTSKQIGNSNNINLLVNNKLVDTAIEAQYIGTEAYLEWPVTELTKGINILSIESGAGKRTFEIEVEESDIFNPITDSAVLLLSAEGRSNNTSLERRLEWEYTRDKTTISANLNNFNWYNNGWVIDDNKRVCLRISNGANVQIPIQLFKDSQPTVGGCTIEFEFKPYNLYNYQLLTISASSSGEDEKVEIHREFDSSKATIKYVQGEGANAYGFCLGTQDAYFRLGDGSNVSVRYRDDEIVNVAMVVDAAKQQMYIYINGIMSGMTGYTRSSGSLPLYADSINITSEYCDLDLYNIRIYEKALTSEEIVQNYISSRKDLALYRANTLSAGETINLNDLIEYNNENPENATIPYMIITTKAPDILPYVKVENDDNATIVDIDFVNPALDYNFSLGKYTEDEYLHKAPSFKASNVILNVQGTSSQKYPRKNFKAKFKKSTIECSNEKIENKSMSKIYLDSNIGEKTFTWKADFMDSSGSHNTGFASFVKLLYKKHPLDYYEGTENTYQNMYRTTIYGFPMLVFHKKSNGSIDFIGKYNFNLDKGCDDTLGFTHNGINKILNKPYEEVAECWEFGNNQGGRCSFRGQPFDYGYDYNTKTGKLNLIDDLEVRYHYNGDAIEQAFKNLAEDEVTVISDEEAFNILLGGTEAGSHPNGYGNLERLFLWLQEVDFVSETDETLKATKKERFINEFTKHFNMEYSLVYYIMTELLIQYDSRGKNMMLGTWGPLEENGEYIWFPMYYDIDTQLGVDNSGIPSWEYNVEPSNEKHFSTNNSILWTCFKEAFADRIQTKYVELRSGNLSIDKLNGYYEFNPEVSNSEAMRGILPISFINADQYYKYIAPALKDSNKSYAGYIGNDDSGNPIKKYTSGYYYCLQGTRDLHRALFLRNRFNYYDSMWMAGAYNPTTATDSTMRIRITEHTDLGDLNSTTVVNLTPKLDQYVLAWADESKTNLVPKKAKSGEAIVFDITEAVPLESYDKQLIYFGGANYIQNLGDLSLLYINELEIPTSSLVSIVLGNENSAYQNKNISLEQIKDINTKAPQNLLKLYDLTNLSTLNSSISIDTAPKLEVFKGLGTKLTGVNFAEGVALKSLYLPETINELNLIEATQLDKIFYNKNDILDEDGKQTKEGMYIEDVVHMHSEANILVARLNNIKIVGGSLKNNSYDLLNKVTEAKLAIQNYGESIEGYTDGLGVHMEKVQWSPYIKLGEGADYDETAANTFKYANNNFTYSDYEYTNESDWNRLLAEGRIYKFDSSAANNIIDLGLLDTYIENNKFTNITTTTDIGLPIITGELFVNNATSINEADIANYYNMKFPGLNIRAAKVEDAYRARFVRIEDNNSETELFSYRYNKNDENLTIVPPTEDKIAIPSHYDFVGWKLQGTEKIYKTDDDFATLDFSQETTEYVFELQYTKHTYTITYLDNKSEYSEKVKVLYDNYLIAPSRIPWRKNEEIELELEERLGFKGWSTKEEDANTLIDVTTIKADRDLTFYAVFEKENVYDFITDNKYFNFANITLNSINGYSIALNPSYQLQGKITLPVVYNNKPILAIANNGFQADNFITHIFWDKKNVQKVLQIGNNAFDFYGKQNYSLIYFDFIDSIEKIEDFAFGNQQKLQGTKLPLNLVTIGKSAFNYCLSTSFSNIGNKVQTIEDGAFIGAIGRNFAILTIGDSVKTIGARAFASYQYDGPEKLIEVQIGSGIETIGENAFESQNLMNPNINTITSIIINKPEDSVSGAPWGASKESIQWVG